MNASRIPFFLSSFERFRKKLTVIGMIGQMQGMQTASRPATKPMSSSHSNDCLARSSPEPRARSSSVTGVHKSSATASLTVATKSTLAVSILATGAAVSSAVGLSTAAGAVLALSSDFVLTAFAALATGRLPCCFSATSEGGRQLASLQAPYSR